MYIKEISLFIIKLQIFITSLLENKGGKVKRVKRWGSVSRDIFATHRNPEPLPVVNGSFEGGVVLLWSS